MDPQKSESATKKQNKKHNQQMDWTKPEFEAKPNQMKKCWFNFKNPNQYNQTTKQNQVKINETKSKTVDLNRTKPEFKENLNQNWDKLIDPQKSKSS